MPAPYPYDAVSGRRSLRAIAGEIVANYCWLARWSDEIGNDADMDMKKLAQLAFQHCRLFRQELQPFLPFTAGSPLLPALEHAFARIGMSWPTRMDMRADLAAIFAECGNLYPFVRDNVPAARTLSSRVYDANGVETEDPVKIPKDPVIAAEVAKLRALFA